MSFRTEQFLDSAWALLTVLSQVSELRTHLSFRFLCECKVRGKNDHGIDAVGDSTACTNSWRKPTLFHEGTELESVYSELRFMTGGTSDMTMNVYLLAPALSENNPNNHMIQSFLFSLTKTELACAWYAGGPDEPDTTRKVHWIQPPEQQVSLRIRRGTNGMKRISPGQDEGVRLQQGW